MVVYDPVLGRGPPLGLATPIHTAPLGGAIRGTRHMALTAAVAAVIRSLPGLRDPLEDSGPRIPSALVLELVGTWHFGRPVGAGHAVHLAHEAGVDVRVALRVERRRRRGPPLPVPARLLLLLPLGRPDGDEVGVVVVTLVGSPGLILMPLPLGVALVTPHTLLAIVAQSIQHLDESLSPARTFTGCEQCAEARPTLSLPSPVGATRLPPWGPVRALSIDDVDCAAHRELWMGEVLYLFC